MNEFVLEEATITGIHEAMKKGRLTCRQLVSMYCDRIKAFDQQGPRINSVILVNPDLLAQADQLDAHFRQKGFLGPLHGIPVLLKDNIDTQSMPTTGGSRSLAGVTPAEDAFIVKKMLAAGAIILAKVNLHEFAVWGETVSSILGQTLNPYDITRTPGGSSGGTGAGIAANFGVIGIGTDTVNSVRSPASACCLTAIRPTLGLVSRSGIIPYSLTQDTAGPLTRCLTDAAVALTVIAGYDQADEMTSWSVGHIPPDYSDCLKPEGLGGKRLGALRSCFGSGNEHKEVNVAMAGAIDLMRSSGAEVIDIDECIDTDKLVADVSVHLYELRDHLDGYLRRLRNRAPVGALAEVIASGQYHPGIEANIKKAMTLKPEGAEYWARLAERGKLQTCLMQLMAVHRLDGLLYPHQKRLAASVGQSQLERNGVIGAVSGFPSVILPAGFSSPAESAPDGVPIGLEILGRPWSEPALIEMGYGFEQASRWRRLPWYTPALS